MGPAVQVALGRVVATRAKKFDIHTLSRVVRASSWEAIPSISSSQLM